MADKRIWAIAIRDHQGRIDVEVEGPDSDGHLHLMIDHEEWWVFPDELETFGKFLVKCAQRRD